MVLVFKRSYKDPTPSGLSILNLSSFYISDPYTSLPLALKVGAPGIGLAGSRVPMSLPKTVSSVERSS